MSGLYCFKILAIELALSTYSPLWQIDSKKSGIKSVYLLQQLLFQYRFHIFWRVIAVFCRFLPLLAVFGGFWPFVVVFGGFWRFLAVFGR